LEHASNPQNERPVVDAKEDDKIIRQADPVLLKERPELRLIQEIL